MRVTFTHNTTDELRGIVRAWGVQLAPDASRAAMEKAISTAYRNETRWIERMKRRAAA